MKSKMLTTMLSFSIIGSAILAAPGASAASVIAESTVNKQESNTSAFQINRGATYGLTAPRATTAEREANSVNAIKAIPSTDTESFSALAIINIQYKFWELKTGTFVDSLETFEVSKAKDVKLTLVQYPEYKVSGTAKLYYQLVASDSSGKKSEEIEVAGNYSSSNTSITFKNVPAATYKLSISNYTRGGGCQAQGNGYTNN